MLQRYESCIQLKGKYVEHVKKKEEDSSSDESDDYMIQQPILMPFVALF